MTRPVMILSNLRAAIRNNETVVICGGEFERAELQELIDYLEQLASLNADLLEACKAALRWLAPSDSLLLAGGPVAEAIGRLHQAVDKAKWEMP